MNKAPPTPEQIAAMAELAHALSKNPHDRARLSLAAQQIASGNGRLLFEAVFDTQRVSGGDQDTQEINTVALLDRMMRTRPGVAGYLLARLMSIVTRHDTYDGIEFSLGANPTEELADNLMLIAGERFRPSRRKYYERWASEIREASKRTKSQSEEGKGDYQRPSSLRQSERVDFLEDVTSEERIRVHVVALAREGHGGLASCFIFQQHVYEAVAAMDERAIVKAYLTFLGYRPEARGQPPSVSRHEPLAELDVDLAYTLLGEVFRRYLAGPEQPATEAEAQAFVQRVREATEAWAVLAFTNLETPPDRKPDVLADPFHRVITDHDDEAGVILVGEQDIAMIWFFDGAMPNRRGTER